MVTCDRAFQEWDLFGEHDRYTFETAIEKVSDFIRRLEKMFRVAYGRDAITPGTRDALLYGQLQEGLSHHLVGPWLFRVLPGVAARNEERRLVELRNCRRYQTTQKPKPLDKPSSSDIVPMKKPMKPSREVQCFNCRKPGHMARECKEPRREYTKIAWGEHWADITIIIAAMFK